MIRAAVLLVLLSFVSVASARAQDPPPRIPLFVADVQGNIARWGQDPLLAASRDIQDSTTLPGSGFGGQVGLHLHVFKFKAVTVGIGGQVMLSRGRQTPASDLENPPAAVTERFRSFGTQLSLNFGNGNGWSYLSGGIGRSNWSVVPDGKEPLEADDEVLKTINYGGGARWFAKSHLAFSFDVRLYAINPGLSSRPDLPGSPRTTFMVIGAGISVK
jgi:hypothetical protein